MKNHLLINYLFILLFLPVLAGAQCGGTLKVNSTTGNTGCLGSTAGISLSGLAGGWQYKIYKDSISPASLISNTFSVSVVLDTTPLIVYFATADSAGCTQKEDSILIDVVPPPFINISPLSATVCAGGIPVIVTASGGSTYVWSPDGQTTSSISVTAPGTYSVTGTVGSCSSTKTITVSPGTPPTVSIFPSSPTVCPGGTPATLTASGASTYVWSPCACTTSSISVTAPGTYTVTGRDASGCSTTSTINVTPGTPPTINISPSSPTVCPGGTPAIITASGASTYVWSPGGATTSTISVTATGTYTVTGRDVKGCSNTSTVTVFSGTPPTVNITASSPTICNDYPVILTITGNATTYMWNAGATTTSIVVSAAGTYSVAGTNALGCVSIRSITINAASSPIASFTLTPDPDTAHHYIAVNNSSGIPPLIYAWTWGDGSPYDSTAYPKHQFPSAGFYDICLFVTDSNKCTSFTCDSLYHIMRSSDPMYSVTVYAPTPTGIEKIDLQSMSIYPNPAFDVLLIQHPAFNEPVFISIADVLGKTVIAPAVSYKTTNEAVISIKELQQGIYFLQIKSGKEVYTRAFIKQSY